MAGLGERIRSAGAQLSKAAPDMIPGWLTAAGIGGWLFVGVAATLWIVAWFLGASSSISIPLILALVIGMVAYPLCARMTDRGVPKSVAAGTVLALLALIVVGVIWITLAGVISQLPAIQAQLQSGGTELVGVLSALGVDASTVTSFIQSLQSSPDAVDAAGDPITRALFASVGSVLTTSLSGTFSFLFGVFISATLLYYVLADFPTVSRWLGSNMAGLPVEVGEGIVEDAVRAMRGYFRANTISGLVVAAVIGGSMLVMGVPLWAPVALVTFLTVYIPFFGAIFSGAFAFVVALGSAGLGPAVVLLVIVLVAQNVLQTVINARLMGDSMNLHPLVVLVATMLGGIFGGLLGAALGAPVAALLVSAGQRLSAAFAPSPDGAVQTP